MGFVIAAMLSVFKPFLRNTALSQSKRKKKSAFQRVGISHQEAGKSPQVPAEPKCNLTAVRLLSERTMCPKAGGEMAPGLQAKLDCE